MGAQDMLDRPAKSGSMGDNTASLRIWVAYHPKSPAHF